MSDNLARVNVKQRAPQLESVTRGGLVTTRSAALVASLMLVLLVLSPVVENFKKVPEDSFPLSHFPMFATKRDDDLNVTHMVGVADNGRRSVIPYEYAAPGGFNSARKHINRLRRDGASHELCLDVARGLAERPGVLGHVREVQIVTGTYEYEDFFKGVMTPSDERVHASCPVVR